MEEEMKVENLEEEKVNQEVNTSHVHESSNQEIPPNNGKKNSKKKKFFDKEKEELKTANLELKEKVLRITAEMQNMRRRYDLDLSNAYKYDGFDFVEKLLPVIDNFERAMNAKTTDEKFLEGFRMIYDNLMSILNSKGVAEVECLNKEFDPNIMNAVVTEVNMDVPEGTVLEVLQKGYMYNERLIRPAMVKVSAKENE